MPQFAVTSTCYPGASFQFVLDQLEKQRGSFKKQDLILIIGGTNRTEPGHFQNAAKTIKKLTRIVPAIIILPELSYLYQ